MGGLPPRKHDGSFLDRVRKAMEDPHGFAAADMLNLMMHIKPPTTSCAAGTSDLTVQPITATITKFPMSEDFTTEDTDSS